MTSTEKIFDLAFTNLTRSSDRTRTIVYISIILNFSVFFALVSTIFVNFPTERAGRFLRALDCVSLPEGARTEECKNLLSQYKEQGTEFPNQQKSKWFFGVPEGPADAIKWRMLEHRGRQLVESIFSQSKYRFPIFGIEVETEFLWIASSFVGILTLTIVRATWARENDNIAFAREAAEGNEALHKLLLSTQMLTPDRVGMTHGIQSIIRMVHSSVLFCAMSFPIASQCMIIYDQSSYWSAISSGHRTISVIAIYVCISSLIAMIIICIQIYKEVKRQEREYEAISTMRHASEFIRMLKEK